MMQQFDMVTKLQRIQYNISSDLNSKDFKRQVDWINRNSPRSSLAKPFPSEYDLNKSRYTGTSFYKSKNSNIHLENLYDRHNMNNQYSNEQLNQSSFINIQNQSRCSLMPSQLGPLKQFNFQPVRSSISGSQKEIVHHMSQDAFLNRTMRDGGSMSKFNLFTQQQDHKKGSRNIINDHAYKTSQNFNLPSFFNT